MEALDRCHDEIGGKHSGLIERLHTFQLKHFENRKQIGNLNYESKIFWVNLAEQYIKEASPQLYQRSIHYPNSWAHETELAELVTCQLFERGIVATFLFVLVLKISVAQAQLK
jgi:hypothetical protein